MDPVKVTLAGSSQSAQATSKHDSSTSRLVALFGTGSSRLVRTPFLPKHECTASPVHDRQ